jgi:hypothetical protein
MSYSLPHLIKERLLSLQEFVLKLSLKKICGLFFCFLPSFTANRGVLPSIHVTVGWTMIPCTGHSHFSTLLSPTLQDSRYWAQFSNSMGECISFINFSVICTNPSHFVFGTILTDRVDYIVLLTFVMRLRSSPRCFSVFSPGLHTKQIVCSNNRKNSI